MRLLGLLCMCLAWFQYTIPAHTGAIGTAASGTSGGCFNALNSVGSTSCNVTGVTAGQLLLIDSSEFNGTVCSTCLTDNNGTPIHLLGPTTFYGNGSDDVWYEKNAAAGTHTLTATYAVTGNYTSLLVNVVSGVSTTSPIDSSSVSEITANITNCPALTTTGANEQIWSFASAGGGGWSFTTGTVPQIMTMTQTSGAQDVSASGIAVTAGSNYVEWSHAGVTEDWACDTIAVH